MSNNRYFAICHCKNVDKNHHSNTVAISNCQHKRFINPIDTVFKLDQHGYAIGKTLNCVETFSTININLTNCFRMAQAHSRIGIYSEFDPSEAKRLSLVFRNSIALPLFGANQRTKLKGGKMMSRPLEENINAVGEILSWCVSTSSLLILWFSNIDYSGSRSRLDKDWAPSEASSNQRLFIDSPPHYVLQFMPKTKAHS